MEYAEIEEKSTDWTFNNPRLTTIIEGRMEGKSG